MSGDNDEGAQAGLAGESSFDENDLKKDIGMIVELLYFIDKTLDAGGFFAALDDWENTYEGQGPTPGQSLIDRLRLSDEEMDKILELQKRSLLELKGLMEGSLSNLQERKGGE